MIKKIILFLSFSLFSQHLLAQQSQVELENKLNELAKQKKGLTEILKIDVSGLNVKDFVKAIAEQHQLNIDIDSDINQAITNNFFDVTVKDVFLYLAEKYSLEFGFLNNIITIRKKKEIKIIEKKSPKVIDVSYNAQNDFLSVKIENDTLSSVAKAITEKSGKNIVLSAEIKATKISSYILNRPFDQVIDMLAKSNDLVATKDDNGFFFLEKNKAPQAINGTLQNNYVKQKLPKPNIDADGFYDVEINKKGFLNVKANVADTAELLKEAADKLHISYFLYNKPENEKTSLAAENITFDDLLNHVFKGKKYTYKKQNDLYLIGEQITEGLRETELIQLENRSIEFVIGSLPKVFTEKLEIKEFVELNGLIVSGAKNILEELKIYLKQIDKIVPMVQIEVIIVQYNKGHDVQTGMKAVLDKLNKVETGGTIFPTTDVNINASSANSIIDAFNGFGIFKLGKVTNAFYMNLKMLENNSIVNIESTPKIATISGHEAKLSIGETSYYFEQNNRLINNNIGNDILQSGTWKSTEANLSVSIKPYVSTDENVTLNISVEKSSFLGRVGENAPPGKASQKFESLVRVKNNEMILLGGLEELKKEDSGTGVPLLSRIPLIKWFFSSRKKGKNTSKLHIFIKPTVVY